MLNQNHNNVHKEHPKKIDQIRQSPSYRSIIINRLFSYCVDVPVLVMSSTFFFFTYIHSCIIRLPRIGHTKTARSPFLFSFSSFLMRSFEYINH
jgi:hypothetical protein